MADGVAVTETLEYRRSESDAKDDPGPRCDVECQDDMHLLADSIIRAYAD